MAATRLSRKTLEELKQRHLAFLEQRLTSAQARKDWVRACHDAYEEFLGVRIRDVLDPKTTARLLQRALDDASVRDFFAPALKELHREVLARLKSDRRPVGEYVPAQARLAIDSLLERRDLVPDGLVRKLFEQQAVEDAIDDTLYDALMQFNTTVNPFFADWGLPSILKRMPIAGGMILSSMEALRAEFDRRLEPEVRRFLNVFSRRATGQIAEMFLARSGDPRLLELRSNLLVFLYTQSISEILAGVGEKEAGNAAEATEQIVRGLLDREASERGLERALASFIDKHGDETIGQWVHAAGATGTPNLEAWADLLWPRVEGVLSSTVFRDFLARITAEFYDTL